MADGSRKTVLITGAGGVIGTVLRRAWRDRYDLRLLSRDPIPDETDACVADICDADAIARAFDGIDVVVHLAASARPEATWDEVLPDNIVGTYNVFEAARRARVRRVVFASSTHAVGGFYEAARLAGFDLPVDQRVGNEVGPWPDSLYGVSKVFGEALGRHYHDKFGMAVICLRIGFVRGDADDTFRPADDVPPEWREMYRRAGALWLSWRDCASLFERAVEADTTWAVVYATSDNPRQVWDLTSARELLAYRPQDHAPD